MSDQINLNQDKDFILGDELGDTGNLFGYVAAIERVFKRYAEEEK